MKTLILLLILSINVFAYDAVIKDKYGRVQGYIDSSNPKQDRFVDKFGRTKYYVIKETKNKKNKK